MSTDVEKAYYALKDQKLLWHYTGWDAFKKIVESKELWATDYRVLNDRTELRHGLEVAKGKYAGKLAYVDHYVDRIIADDSYLPTTYLISFSRDFDSLSQWRGYSQQTIGVALGFNDERLARVAHLYGFRRLECVYKIGQKQALFEEQIETWRKHFEKLEEEVKRNPDSVMARHSLGRFATLGQHGELDKFLSDIAPRLKHEAFEYEAEIRLVSTSPRPE